MRQQVIQRTARAEIAQANAATEPAKARLTFDEMPALTRREISTLLDEIEQVGRAVNTSFTKLDAEAKGQCLLLANSVGRLSLRLTKLLKRV
ncbi:MAG: hypothetical protein KGJ13_10280 [Patescibacteria group bacterium]|nr:hypothetical protein [Patescibacteria group bacterium]